ncbi:hypothetical protein J6590_067987 [Homalodisca vitripennis]|nr:hypothetical protein J6590_067987 [Homalodisca vitripennis]
MITVKPPDSEKLGERGVGGLFPLLSLDYGAPTVLIGHGYHGHGLSTTRMILGKSSMTTTYGRGQARSSETSLLTSFIIVVLAIFFLWYINDMPLCYPLRRRRCPLNGPVVQATLRVVERLAVQD